MTVGEPSRAFGDGHAEETTSERAVAFAEFFAGIGLVRSALEPLGFHAAWANDIEKAKRDQYAANHPAGHFDLRDVRDVHADQLPEGIELATSSFPCIDVSLAGNRKGLAGVHSGMFWEFARVIGEFEEEKRPRAVLLENVTGFASSHGGQDIREALNRLNELGYSCDVFTIDARHFVPQSRPRMFVVGIRGNLPKRAVSDLPPISDIRPRWVQHLYVKNKDLRMHFVTLPSLPIGPEDLSGVVERMSPGDPRWWDDDRTNAFIKSLSQIQSERFDRLRAGQGLVWRTAYRRTRNGKPVWEIRRDGIAGCLRTTGGGSSKQALLEAGNGVTRVRWMTPTEYARLMGAVSYKIHGGTLNQALFGLGDAVVVDVIRWIGEHCLRPLLRSDCTDSSATLGNDLVDGASRTEHLALPSELVM
jgi:DNA (cytosine-5)-methyltransferase 1